MNFIRSFIFVLSAQVCLCAGCQHDTASQSNPPVATDSLTPDSDALVLSLTPTVESLPLYYASHSGIFKTLGLKVSLKTYASQFDCDTAMLGHTAIGGVTDLVRLHYHAEKGKVLTAVSALDGQWRLLASGDLRIKKTTLLKDRMVAGARFSTADFFCEEALGVAKMEYNDVMHPQINDDRLRASMLKNHQLDAAVLPEPFATQAKLAGHQVLYSSRPKSYRLGCLVFKPSVLQSKDSVALVKKILKGYDEAVVALNTKGTAACRDILLHDYQLPAVVIDSLVLPKYQSASMPEQIVIERCQDFLRVRSRWTASQTPDALFNKEILTD